MLFSFLAKASPAKFNQTVATINWEQISVTFGDDWSNLFHDAEVFLGVCFHRTEHRAAITTLIERNAHRIEVLAPRLALKDRLPPDSDRIADIVAGLSRATSRHHVTVRLRR